MPSSTSVSCALAALAALLSLSSGARAAPSSPAALALDWPSFLARSDPVWSWGSPNATTARPTEWVQSLFGGNGDLGFMLWSSSETALELHVNRQTLWDDRTPDLGLPYYLDDFALDQPRLPVGYFRITWRSGAVPSGVEGRVSLFDGVASLNVTTPSGSCALAAWASAVHDSSAPGGNGGADAIVLETSWTGAEACVVAWVTQPCVSTWSGNDNRYVFNPAALNKTATLSPELELTLVSQQHLPQKGTWHSSAVLRSQFELDAATFFFTVSPVLGSQAAADAWARNEVLAAQGQMPGMRAAHEADWHAWWPAGGAVTFEYSLLESFWYIQLFKFRSGSRRGVVHDLEGPWFIDGTPWPDLHWDMNLEQTYYLPIAVNRPELANTLVDYVQFLLESGNLNSNVPEVWRSDSAAAPTGASSLSGNETCYWNYGANCTTSPPSVTGNLLWTLSLVRMAALYSGNTTIDTAILWPLLDRALQFYQHFQLTAADGTITLPVTFSPEWPGGSGPDANYDKSLYRWGLATAIDLADTYGLTSPHLQAWKDTLAHIAWFGVDAATDTFEIYDGVPYNTPHRHYSHLFMIWPLRLLDVSNSSQYATARNSINLWLATPETDSMFYRPAASAMNVLLGQRAAAFDNITFLLHNRVEGSTWYREGSQGSCTETPYAAAWAVTDWLVQSWNLTSAAPGGKPVRIVDFFPAVDDVIALGGADYDAAPAKVATAQFFRLSVEGGVLATGSRALVSANSTHYVTRTAFVAVERLADAAATAPLVLRTNMARPLATSPAGVSITELGDGGLVLVGIGAGEGVAIFSAAAPPADFGIRAAAGCPQDFNHFGAPLSGGGGGPGVGGSPVVLRACAAASGGLAAPNHRYAFNASTGEFALQDGSGRCLSVATCDGANGDRVTLAPCASRLPPPPPPPGGGGIGCDASIAPTPPQVCAAASQTWAVNAGPSPNSIAISLSGRCIDVNGANQRDVIDVWDCSGPTPGAFKNEEFAFDAASGAITSLCTDPDCACEGFCITPSV